MHFDFGSFFGDLFNNFKDWLTDFLETVQAAIFLLLPDSPFANLTLPDEIKQFLGYINWVIPFYMIGNTLLVWSIAVAGYYAYQTILRWIKSIQ